MSNLTEVKHDHPRVAIVGVGNCASALVQGTQYYADNDTKEGLVRHMIGPYAPEHVQFSAAFDVDPRKVGHDLGRAINLGENNTWQMVRDPWHRNVQVVESPVMDGLGRTYRSVLPALNGRGDRPTSEEDVEFYADILSESDTTVLVNYLPVGSEVATRFWADVCLTAGVGMVNAIPVFIASDPQYQAAFEERNLPLMGDDIKSQFGATILHRLLARLVGARGYTLDKTYQLNFGGNMDFRNMLDHERLASKKKSKTGAVQAEYDIEDDLVHISPSDYVPWLKDEKWCYINMHLSGFGGAPSELELKLKVWDSPNSAGCVIDCVRICHLALRCGLGGTLNYPSAVYMKSPPEQIADSQADINLDAWIEAMMNILDPVTSNHEYEIVE